MTLKEKIADAESTDWVREGMTDEEVSQIVTEAKEDARERLSLEEAIKHCEEVAERKQQEGFFRNTRANTSTVEGSKCYECASEHRQLAEWLRELKALKENDDVKDVFMDCDTCKYLSLECDDYPCDRCCHRYINQYVYDDKREVNADADSD